MQPQFGCKAPPAAAQAPMIGLSWPGRPVAPGRISNRSRRAAFATMVAFAICLEHSRMAMDVVDYEIKGAEMQFVEVELDPGEAAVGEAGSMMFMDAGIQMDTVFGDGSAAAGRRPVRQAARRRQAPGHRRVAVHDGLHQPGARQAARRLRRAVPGQDPADGPAPARRHADLPEGRLPVRRARRVARHLLPAEARRSASSAARASSCRSSTATAWPSCTPAARVLQARAAGRARRCSSTPAAWSR